jgi:hypothetical protein
VIAGSNAERVDRVGGSLDCANGESDEGENRGVLHAPTAHQRSNENQQLTLPFPPLAKGRVREVYFQGRGMKTKEAESTAREKARQVLENLTGLVTELPVLASWG